MLYVWLLRRSQREESSFSMLRTLGTSLNLLLDITSTRWWKPQNSYTQQASATEISSQTTFCLTLTLTLNQRISVLLSPSQAGLRQRQVHYLIKLRKSTNTGTTKVMKWISSPQPLCYSLLQQALHLSNQLKKTISSISTYAVGKCSFSGSFTLKASLLLTFSLLNFRI